ncbi:MAG: hypothetical protein ACREBD_33025 [Blastocatellia bacterium]
MNPSRLLWIVGFALLVMAVNIAVSVLYMVVYGYFINPGQPEQHYQEHVRIAAPYSSIIAGAPLFYLAGRWLTRRWETGFRLKAALLIWLVYALIDLAVLGASGFTRRLAIFAAISLATKFGAAYLGGVAASRRS